MSQQYSLSTRSQPSSHQQSQSSSQSLSQSHSQSQELPRYFANDAPLSRRDPHKQLVSCLDHIVTAFPPDSVSPSGGFYTGAISIAYLFFTLQEFYSDLEIQGIKLGTWCAVYLKTAQDAFRTFRPPTPSHCGITSDILTLLALGAASSKDPDMVEELCDYVEVVVDDGASDEWLYGRAGYLYLLRLARASFADDEATLKLIDEVADEVIEVMLASPRPFKWHGKAYVGAAHGVVGILTQIVLTQPSLAPQVEAELGALLSYQYESGNWPSSLPPGRDRLVQFCHGAPGVITSLECIKGYFSSGMQGQISSAVAKGRDLVWNRGLLTKEPCLCHGISGNALVLGEDKEVEHFLSYSTRSEIKAMDEDGMLEDSGDPDSLWCGEAGRAWAWAVVDKGLPRRFLGYNDI